MSDPLVCANCGTPNRPNAKFCIGCAGRLPGVAPAGAMPAHAPAEPPLDPYADREPPMAAAAASRMPFWLHPALVVFTMFLAFVVWCLYVLHGRPTPLNRRPPPTPPVAESLQPPPVPAPTQAVASTPTPIPAPTQAAAPTLTPIPTPLPAPTPMPPPPTRKAAAPEPPVAGRGGTGQQPTPAAIAQALALQQQAARLLQSVAPPVGTPAAPHAAPPERARNERQTVARTAPRVRRDPRDMQDAEPLRYTVGVDRPSAQPDLGPPLAPGPGPQYSWKRPSPSPRTADDLGPPVATGPGPRYDTRPEVRAPVTASADGGPPIAIGPGPRYDARPEVRAPGTPSADAGPPIVVGPGPRYDYSTPAGRTR
jgi:hypothetical protein